MHFLILLLVVTLLLLLSAPQFTTQQSTVEDVVYLTYSDNPNSLLMDKAGQYGSKTSSSGVLAILQLLETEEAVNSFIQKPPSEKKILVVPSFLLTLPQIIEDLQNTHKVVGLILLDSDNYTLPTRSFSPGPEIDDTGFSWNPYGTSLFTKAMPFPLWLLGTADSAVVRQRALENDHITSYPFNAGQITSFMFPEQKDNSLLCLSRAACDPLGGHSVWTSLSPLNTSKEIMMVIAGMDSRSLFQKKSVGANSAISGTVALLGAMQALINNPNTVSVSQWEKQAVFAWFDGESFGNLGSTRFIKDIYSHNECINSGSNNCGGGAPYMNIQLDQVSSIIELKQVGAVNGSGFFVHSNDHTVTGPSATALFLAGSISNIPVGTASPSTPGLPPSSLKAILKTQPKFSQNSVVLTDHSGPYENRFYESIFDTYKNIDFDRICSACTLLARAIYILVVGNENMDVSPSRRNTLETINCNSTWLKEILDCLTRNFTCSLLTSFVPQLNGMPVDEFPNHYVGVFQSNSKTIYQKFLHDLVYVTAGAPLVQDKEGQLEQITCGDDSACGDGKCILQKCYQSNTYNHDAVSSNVAIVETEFASYWTVSEPGDPEPLWTESRWSPVPSVKQLRIFKLSDPMIDYIFLVLSIFQVILVICAVILFRRKFDVWYIIVKD